MVGSVGGELCSRPGPGSHRAWWVRADWRSIALRVRRRPRTGRTVRPAPVSGRQGSVPVTAPREYCAQCWRNSHVVAKHKPVARRVRWPGRLQLIQHGPHGGLGATTASEMEAAIRREWRPGTMAVAWIASAPSATCCGDFSTLSGTLDADTLQDRLEYLGDW